MDNEWTSKIVWNLFLLVGSTLAHLNPILYKQSEDKYEVATNQHRPEHKNCLTRWVNQKNSKTQT